jgi:hypothetical protein
LLSALTSGRARTFAQSKPGWFGSTVAVAGSVRAHSRPNALWPRGAPATAARTVAVANATSSARTSAAEGQISDVMEHPDVAADFSNWHS